VMIRYELEKNLIEGSIQVRDIPAYWNEQYEKYLGVKSPDDLHGCLQDVHWSHGSFGYFPTYSLGSFYAAQLFASAKEAITDLDEKIAQGKFSDLLSWLRNQIHSQGRIYTSEELCKKVTGKPLKVQYFLDYILQKYKLIS